MASLTPPLRRSLQSEETYVREMHAYLDIQNERFDQSDLKSLGAHISEHPGFLPQELWKRITSALLTQSSTDPDAAAILRALQAKFRSLIELISEFRSTHTLQDPYVILVGAGGSVPGPTAIPTINGLLPILWNKAEEIGHKPLLELRRTCDSLGIKDIEDLLSAIYLAQDAVDNPRVTALLLTLLRAEPAERREFRGRPSPSISRESRIAEPGIAILETLRESSQTLFSVLVGMMVNRPINPIHRALANRCNEEGRRTTIMTTNYDICIETALGPGRYSYGVPQTDQPQTLAHETALLKLHGSLNWYSCQNCDGYLTARIEDINRAYEAGLYPIITMCRVCQATAQQLIVPPIARKYNLHPVIMDVRQRAEQALQEAKSVIIVGYSFSEADEYILRMISRAVRANPDKDIIVLDIANAPHEALRRFLGTHSRGYDVQSRIAEFLGDAVDSAPLLLNAP